MGYKQWIEENSLPYKGYVIRPGSISKDGEVYWMFISGLGEPKEKSFKNGMAIIDEELSRKSDDNAK